MASIKQIATTTALWGAIAGTTLFGGWFGGFGYLWPMNCSGNPANGMRLSDAYAAHAAGDVTVCAIRSHWAVIKSAPGAIVRKFDPA